MRFSKLLLSIFVLSLVMSCSTSTKITAYWAEKDYEKGQIDKILILGIAKREVVRRLFEHDMVTRLQEIGIEGIPSSEILPPDVKHDTNTFRLQFSAEQFDAILTSQLVSAETSQQYQSTGYAYSPYARNYGFYGYYGSSYDMMYSTGYTITTTTYKIETNLYDARSERLIWSGISDTFAPSDEQDAISSLNRRLVSELQEQGYFKATVE